MIKGILSLKCNERQEKRNTQENNLARSSAVALLDCGLVEEMVHKIVKKQSDE